MIKTFDGKLHSDYDSARHYLIRLYNGIMFRQSIELYNGGSKLTMHRIYNFIDDNLDDFVLLNTIKFNIKLIDDLIQSNNS